MIIGGVRLSSVVAHRGSCVIIMFVVLICLTLEGARPILSFTAP